jgi:hypothetical protein
MTTSVYVKTATLVATVRTLMSLITVSLNLAKMEPSAAISWKITSVIVHKILMYVYMYNIRFSWSSLVWFACVYTWSIALHMQGRNCETDMNMCRSSPCLNNGTCSNSPNLFECTCARRFTGSTCELTIVTDTKPAQQGLYFAIIILYYGCFRCIRIAYILGIVL